MKKIYIRFGLISRNEESAIYHGREFLGLEKGVSVFEAIKEGDKIQILVPSLKDSALGSLAICLDRKARIVTGDLVGTGSDGEPLLKNVTIIKELGIIKEND